MSDSKRVYHPAELKVEAVKRHLINKEKISDICDELGIHPNVFNDWQAKLFLEGSQVFNSAKDKKVMEKKITKLEISTQHKDSVISELVTELIDLKKSLGED